MSVSRNPARAHNRGPWMVCAMQFEERGRTHSVLLHGCRELVEWQPNLLKAFERNGVGISPWEPMPEGSVPAPGAMVLAAPRVVVGTTFVKIRKALAKDLVEEAA